jgi:hypothetical protein
MANWWSPAGRNQFFMTHAVTDLLRQSDLRTSLSFWTHRCVYPKHSLPHGILAVLYSLFLSYSGNFSEFIARQHHLLGAYMISFSIDDQKNDG